MTALSIALIAAGLTLVCGSMIFRSFGGQEPSFSQDSFEEGLFRINDEMWRDELGSTPAEHVPNDRKRRDKQYEHDHAAPDALHARTSHSNIKVKRYAFSIRSTEHGVRRNDLRKRALRGGRGAKASFGRQVLVRSCPASIMIDHWLRRLSGRIVMDGDHSE
jgi:hypothetical protein